MSLIVITGPQVVAAGAAVFGTGAALGIMQFNFSNQAKQFYEGLHGPGSTDGSWEYDALLHAYSNARLALPLLAVFIRRLLFCSINSRPASSSRLLGTLSLICTPFDSD